MQLMLKYQLNSEVAPEFALLPEGDPVAVFRLGHEAALDGFKARVYYLDPTTQAFELRYETPVPDEPTAAARSRRATGD